MVDFDLEKVLSDTLPRQVRSFTITKIARVDENSWRLHFQDPRIIVNRKNGLKEIAEFITLFQWGDTPSGSRYGARLRARKETNIPIRARVWLQQKITELDSQICPSGVNNRLEIKERDTYFDIISIFNIEMNARAAERLAAKEGERLKEFLVSFDAGFYQVAMDAINLVHLDQWYGEHIKKLSS